MSRLIEQRGYPWVKQAVTQGQYSHADGLYYGGSRLEQSATIDRDGDQIVIETNGELSGIVRWLADLDLIDVRIEPVGVATIYDRFHHEHDEV